MRDEKGRFIDYAEARCDHLDESDGFWRVDAWESGDDDEEGSVVAFVHDATGDFVICDPLARLSKLVKEAIEAKRAEIFARERKGSAGEGAEEAAKAEEVAKGAAVAVFAVRGFYRAVVPMGSWSEMADAGTRSWQDADFGAAQDVDAELLSIETLDGDPIPKDPRRHSVAYEMAKAFRRSEPNWPKLDDDGLKALAESFRDHMVRYEESMTFAEADEAWADYGVLCEYAGKRLGVDVDGRSLVLPWE